MIDDLLFNMIDDVDSKALSTQYKFIKYVQQLCQKLLFHC